MVVSKKKKNNDKKGTRTMLKVRSIDEYGPEDNREFTVGLEDTNQPYKRDYENRYSASVKDAELIDLRSVQVAFLKQEGIFFALPDVDANAAWSATLEKFLKPGPPENSIQ